MNVSFQEKSAFGMLLGLALVSMFYFPAAFQVARAVDSAIPLLALIAVGTVVLVVIEVIYHTIIAAASPKDADTSDERDHLIELKSDRNAGWLLGFGLFWLIGWILIRNVLDAASTPPPLEIAVYLMLAITVAEIGKFASQIFYYRLGT